MPTGEEARRGLRVGDVVERDIDGIWFPAKVRTQQMDHNAVINSGFLLSKFREKGILFKWVPVRVVE